MNARYAAQIRAGIALCDDYIQWTQAQQEAKNVDTFHCPKCYTYAQTWNELVILTPLEKR